MRTRQEIENEDQDTDDRGYRTSSRSELQLEVALDTRELLVELNRRLDWQNRGDRPDEVPVRTGRDAQP